MRILKSPWLPLVFLLGVVGLAACGDSTNTSAPPAAAPTTAAAVATTAASATTVASTTAAAGATTAAGTSAPQPTLADAKAEAGRQVVAKNCAGCHLGNGTEAGRAPQLSVSQNAINADFVKNQVRNGKGRMPAFDTTKVSDADLESIIAYLQAIHK